MNIPLLIAAILTLLAFFLHAIQGDRELHLNFPAKGSDPDFQKQEKWTMARAGWHWVSFDLLFAAIGMFLINFTDYFPDEHSLLLILGVYFLGYAVVWFFAVLLSPSFPKNFLKLGQWMLLLVIGGLVMWSAC